MTGEKKRWGGEKKEEKKEKGVEKRVGSYAPLFALLTNCLRTSMCFHVQQIQPVQHHHGLDQVALEINVPIC